MLYIKPFKEEFLKSIFKQLSCDRPEDVAQFTLLTHQKVS